MITSELDRKIKITLTSGLYRKNKNPVYNRWCHFPKLKKPCLQRENFNRCNVCWEDAYGTSVSSEF
jgi:hypothetical protein